MAFGSIEIVSMTRTQEFTTIKQNQDNKPMMDQVDYGQQVTKQTNELTQKVNTGDETKWQDQKPDAKEKGKNEYAGDGGRKRKKEDKSERVIVKGRGGFDIKI
ncbi:MAG: hypothetical protein NC417_03370 [Candidatus Gastranaerophilales bacterium]|nr:hypothetical protein [Candidatus Gastranaerophilales bacterium]